MAGEEIKGNLQFPHNQLKLMHDYIIKIADFIPCLST